MMQPQIWILMTAFLGVAGLALLLDYLKYKNQQLHDAMVELRLLRAQDARLEAIVLRLAKRDEVLDDLHADRTRSARARS